MVASKQQTKVVPFREVGSRSLATATPSNRLAAFKESAEWKQLPRPAQRGYEQRANQLTALIHAGQEHDGAVGASRERHHATLAAWMSDWQRRLAELGESITDEQREALELAKSNELASLLSARQTELDCLKHLHEEHVLDVMTRPAHEWVKRTLGDEIEDVITFGEAELERRGLPPLSFWESVINSFTFGMVADKRVRDAERARLMPPQVGDGFEGEGVVDADFRLQ